jgi:hypothetical protein
MFSTSILSCWLGWLSITSPSTNSLASSCYYFRLSSNAFLRSLSNYSESCCTFRGSAAEASIAACNSLSCSACLFDSSNACAKPFSGTSSLPWFLNSYLCCLDYFWLPGDSVARFCSLATLCPESSPSELGSISS